MKLKIVDERIRSRLFPLTESVGNIPAINLQACIDEEMVIKKYGWIDVSLGFQITDCPLDAYHFLFVPRIDSSLANMTKFINEADGATLFLPLCIYSDLVLKPLHHLGFLYVFPQKGGLDLSSMVTE